MIEIPDDTDNYEAVDGSKKVKLTSLRKVFWPESGFTKRDLLVYYLKLSAVLLPHLKDRAMVMKLYPNGIARDLPSLLWLVNQGCIGLNPWYSRCDNIDRPDFLHFDLDPVPPAGFPEVCEAALLLRDYLAERKISSYPKTIGSRGIHVYVPIQRSPLQKEVWTKAKSMAKEIAGNHSRLLTVEYRIAKRPEGRILID